MRLLVKTTPTQHEESGKKLRETAKATDLIEVLRAVTGEQHARTLLTDDSQFEHWLQTGCAVQTTHSRCANSSPWGGGILDLHMRTRWFLSVQVQRSLWHWFISLYSSKATRDCLWTALALFGQVIDGRWDRILIGWRERAGCRLHPYQQQRGEKPSPRTQDYGFFFVLEQLFPLLSAWKGGVVKNPRGPQLDCRHPRASLPLVVDNWGRYSDFEVKPVPLSAGIFVDKNLIKI